MQKPINTCYNCVTLLKIKEDALVIQNAVETQEVDCIEEADKCK